MLDGYQFTQPGVMSAPPLHAFVSGHRDALRSAADMLLGSAGVALVDTIVDRLSREQIPARSTWRLVEQLRDLLTLRFVHDPMRPEAGCFADIDPTDPCVEDICLLSDGLQHAISATLASPTARAKRTAKSGIVVERRRPGRVTVPRQSAAATAARGSFKRTPRATLGLKELRG